MTIDVYTLPSCMGCKATFRRLDQRGIAYNVHRLDQGATLPEGIDATQAPVVVAGGEWWSGFRPDRVDALRVSVVQ
jgi:glutaredoxin-like protein NrdH